MKFKSQNIYRSSLPLFISLLWVVPVFAQFNQSISVEGNYVPEIIRQDRINTFPRLQKFSLEASPLSYDIASVPANFQPRLLVLPATGWRDTRTFSRNRGYLELGVGSWLNSTLSAGYRFIDSDKTNIGIWCQHNSTSLWKPKLSPYTETDKQYRYDETFGLNFSHKFVDVGNLDFKAAGHLGIFNYYAYIPYRIPTEKELKNSTQTPKQNLTDISASIGWQSPIGTEGLDWYAKINYRYFAYKSYYYYLNDLFSDGISDSTNPIFSELQKCQAPQESDISLEGGLSYPISDSSGLDINLKVQALMYPNNDLLGCPIGPQGYENIQLCPAYSLRSNNLHLRAGVNVNFIANAPSDKDRCSRFYIAPDVKFDLSANPMNLYVHVTGGTELHTLASNYELDYYQSPLITNPIPVYTPLDSKVGVNFGPFSGFSGGFSVAYRISKNQHLGGWYQYCLNYPTNHIPGLPDNSVWADGNRHNLTYDFTHWQTANIKGYSLGAEIKYELGKILRINAYGDYQPQNDKTGYFNGYDRPRWTAGIAAETNPWKTLKCKISYQYRGVRNVFTKAKVLKTSNYTDMSLQWLRLPDITYLNLGFSYDITENFSLWAQADNLLDRHDEMLPGLPAQGMTFYGGIGLKF